MNYLFGKGSRDRSGPAPYGSSRASLAPLGDFAMAVEWRRRFRFRLFSPRLWRRRLTALYLSVRCAEPLAADRLVFISASGS